MILSNRNLVQRFFAIVAPSVRISPVRCTAIRYSKFNSKYRLAFAIKPGWGSGGEGERWLTGKVVLSHSEACFLSVMPSHHQIRRALDRVGSSQPHPQLHCMLLRRRRSRTPPRRACARPFVNRPYVNRLSRWQPGTCTGDLNLLLAIVRKVVANTLVLSATTMKAASDSISKVSQKLDRGQKTELLCN